MIDYYSILKIPRTATIAEIKKAYRVLTEKVQPGKKMKMCSLSDPKPKQIMQAYNILSDEHSRKLYDEHMKIRQKADQIFKRASEQFERMSISNMNLQKCGDSRTGLRQNNQQGIFPPDMFKMFASDFGFPDMERMFKMSDDMMKTTDEMLKIPCPPPDPIKGEDRQTYFKKMSMETSCFNGKRRTRKMINDNGQETVITYEDDEITSKMIDGVPQNIKQIK